MFLRKKSPSVLPLTAFNQHREGGGNASLIKMSSQTQSVTKSKTELKYPSKYKVLFHNDDVTPMEFVIQLLIEVFDKNIDQAKTLTLQVHNEGKAVAGVYSMEIAEQKTAEAKTLSSYSGHPLKITFEEA